MGKQASCSGEGATGDLQTQFPGSTKEGIVLVGCHRRSPGEGISRDKEEFTEEKKKDIAGKEIGMNSQ